MTTRLNPIIRMLAATLCLLLIPNTATDLLAQTAAAPARLKITILEGEGALNNIKLRTAREPIVQVEDENHKPVSGAAVIFLLPDSGASGSFIDGTTMFSTTTDAEGRAVATGLKPNNVAGQYQIRVRVKHGDDAAEATISQTNILGGSPAGTAAGHAFSVKWIVIGIAAAGGVAVGVVAAKGNSPSTTITPGTPTVGAPGVRRAAH